MNAKNINRIIRGLTLSLCLGVIFTHTTVYAAGPLSGPAGGPTPSNDLMKAPMGGVPGQDVGDTKGLGAHCFCKVSCVNLQGQPNSPMTVHDYGTRPGGLYYPPYNKQWKVDECSNWCNGVATPDTGSQAFATAACGLGCPNGSLVKAFSAIGNGNYQANQSIGTLVNIPAVTQLKCPGGWLANQTNVDGGVTADGKCKKLACQPDVISPPPANGTQIGNPPWGFSWGNGFYAWGTSANFGTPTTITVSPAQCHF